MGRSVLDIIASLPKERQDIINEEAERLKKERDEHIKNNPHLPEE